MTYRPTRQHSTECGQMMHRRFSKSSATTSALMHGFRNSLKRRFVVLRQRLTCFSEVFVPIWDIEARTDTCRYGIVSPPGHWGDYNSHESNCQANLFGFGATSAHVSVGVGG